MRDPFVQDQDFTLYLGDVLDVLKEMPDEHVQCVVTSPPYFQQRDYGVEGQLGLEQTPEAYLDTMVEVFREVRRVLRNDGTIWLNMGDSYAGNRSYQVSDSKHQTHNYGKSNASRVPTGLKEKDLMMIPARLAMALQETYYVGRIKDERDRIWLAAMVDAEGCIHIHRRKAGSSAHTSFTKADGSVSKYLRTQDTYGVMVSIANTSAAIIERVQSIVGQGSWHTEEAGSGKQKRKRSLHNFTLTGNQSRELLRELYPYLVAKQQEARIAYHSPSSGEDASMCHEAIKLLHNGLPTTVDKPPPPTMFEPGFYLRSDIIYHKTNAMPESVHDRPTCAHEHVFLLAKSKTYFYDKEAVKEEAEWARWGKQTNPKYDGTTTKGGFIKERSKKAIYGYLSKEGTEKGMTKNLRNVWEITTEPYAEAHFATFPQALVEPCIKAGSAEGQIILDPFCGSGTTALVARKLGRKSIGIELNEEYAAMCAKRLSQLSLLA